jgi:hypothetical protein
MVKIRGVFYLMILTLLMTNCTSEKDEAVLEIKEELSLFIVDNFSMLNKIDLAKTEDSLMNWIQTKYEFEEGFDFKEFYLMSQQKKSIDTLVDGRIIQNIKNRLKRNDLMAITVQNNKYWERVFLSFDDSYVTAETERLYDVYSGWEYFETKTVEYEISPKDGNQYYYIKTFGSEKEHIWKFEEDSQGFCLVGSIDFCS